MHELGVAHVGVQVVLVVLKDVHLVLNEIVSPDDWESSEGLIVELPSVNWRNLTLKAILLEFSVDSYGVVVVVDVEVPGEVVHFSSQGFFRNFFSLAGLGVLLSQIVDSSELVESVRLSLSTSRCSPVAEWLIWVVDTVIGILSNGWASLVKSVRLRLSTSRCSPVAEWFVGVVDTVIGIFSDGWASLLIVPSCLSWGESSQKEHDD